MPDMYRDLGVYLVTFFYCIHGLLFADGRLKRRSALNYPMLFATIWLFTISTSDLVFGLQLNVSSFVSSEATFADKSNWVNVMRSITYVAQTFMADSILVSFQVQSPDSNKDLCSSIGVGSSTERTGKLCQDHCLCGLLRRVR